MYLDAGHLWYYGRGVGICHRGVVLLIWSCIFAAYPRFCTGVVDIIMLDGSDLKVGYYSPLWCMPTPYQKTMHG